MKSGSRLERLLDSGQFVVCGEMSPPQSADGTQIKRKSDYFRGYVDAVNLTDNQSAVVRMSSIASAILLSQEGLEPIIQMTCRDRNRLAMQSDLLGASAFGIKNVLCLSGDHQSMGNHPYAKSVFDIDSVHLINMAKKMRDDKLFECGEEMKVEPRLFIGCAANPYASPFEFRVVRLQKKIEAGADFVQTQAIFDIKVFEEFMKLVRQRDLHNRAKIIAGILPVRSAKALMFIKDNVAGMSIPDDILNRMSGAEDPKEEGVSLAVELIQQLRGIEGVAGVHIMPVMWESIVPTIVERAGLLPRPEPAGMDDETPAEVIPTVD
ncbi:MAG: methylenetetrahydrofolate reductase [Armatimonadota bacterium]|nr:methylenetetrahydrofolate reductase [Armatimonadota bacterium]